MKTTSSLDESIVTESVVNETPSKSSNIQVTVILYRHTYKQLWEDKDFLAVSYRVACEALNVTDATHVAVWLRGSEPSISLEFGYSWKGSYVRLFPEDRAECFYQLYDMPVHFVTNVAVNSQKESHRGVGWSDLWRHYKGMRPKHHTCLTWAQQLLGIRPEYWANTMAELENNLYFLGGEPRYGNETQKTPAL